MRRHFDPLTFSRHVTHLKFIVFEILMLALSVNGMYELARAKLPFLPLLAP